MHDVLPLELLASGQWADVEDISGEPALVTRLAELGLRIGSRLKVLQCGSPCLLQLGEARLSVRADTKTQILVRPLAS